MKLVYTLVITLFLSGCDGTKVLLPDHKPQIDKNSAEVKLLKAENELQDLRLSSLEGRVSDLESRMNDAEDAIDANEEKLSELCETVSLHSEELESLRSDFRDAVRKLRKADRKTRRMLRSSVAELRSRLMREIRSRRLADANLQRQLDSLERTVQRNEARQSLINRFLFAGLYQAHSRISQLSSRISSALRRINRTLSGIQRDIDDINRNISRLSRAIRNIYNSVNELEDSMVSVVEACDGQHLLSTPDGLFGVGFETREVTEEFESEGGSFEYFVCDRFVNHGTICVRGHNEEADLSNGGSFSYDVIDDVFLTPVEEPVCEED